MRDIETKVKRGHFTGKSGGHLIDNRLELVPRVHSGVADLVLSVNDSRIKIRRVGSTLGGTESVSLLGPLGGLRAEQVIASSKLSLRIRRLVESHFEGLGDGRLVGVDGGDKFGVLENLAEHTGAVLELEESSLLARVRLHTGEVPSAELVEVNDTVLVEVEIGKGSIELVVVERLTEVGGEGTKLLTVDVTAGVLIVLVESRLDNIGLLLLAHGSELSTSILELSDGILRLDAIPGPRLDDLLLKGIGKVNSTGGGEHSRDGSVKIVVVHVGLHLDLIIRGLSETADHAVVEGSDGLALEELSVVRNLELDVVVGRVEQELELVDLGHGALVGGNSKEFG